MRNGKQEDVVSVTGIARVQAGWLRNFNSILLGKDKKILFPPKPPDRL